MTLSAGVMLGLNLRPTEHRVARETTEFKSALFEIIQFADLQDGSYYASMNVTAVNFGNWGFPMKYCRGYRWDFDGFHEHYNIYGKRYLPNKDRNYAIFIDGIFALFVMGFIGVLIEWFVCRSKKRS